MRGSSANEALLHGALPRSTRPLGSCGWRPTRFPTELDTLPQRLALASRPVLWYSIVAIGPLTQGGSAVLANRIPGAFTLRQGLYAGVE